MRPQKPQYQHQYQRPTNIAPIAPSNGLVSAAQAAAAAISVGKAPSRPAYISVASGPPKTGAASHTAAALNPQNWPPAVKAYVERAFKAASFRQRSKLQDVLRILIGDAQDKGKNQIVF